MTEPVPRRDARGGHAPAAGARPRRAPTARPPAWPVVAGGVGAFLATMAFLAGEVREGRDPALGPAKPRPRGEVVVRRVVRRVVVTDRAQRPRRAPAPAQPAPAPAAPAPDPDPITTQAS